MHALYIKFYPNNLYLVDLLVDKVMFVHNVDYEYIKHLIKGQGYVFVERIQYPDN